ncbi:uncharacterized protein [Amphiura filiformis]|uniref:uncharacterized protein n=1 Tax=Amphiura filiformis TaxID=82378 RepID=UPI003B20DE5E
MYIAFILCLLLTLKEAEGQIDVVITENKLNLYANADEVSMLPVSIGSTQIVNVIWRYSSVDETNLPTNPESILIQRTPGGVTCPNEPCRFDIDENNNLIFKSVSLDDGKTQFWCDVAAGDGAGQGSTVPTVCAYGSFECSAVGNDVKCSATQFTPDTSFGVTCTKDGDNIDVTPTDPELVEDFYTASLVIENPGEGSYTCCASGDAYRFAEDQQICDDTQIVEQITSTILTSPEETTEETTTRELTTPYKTTTNKPTKDFTDATTTTESDVTTEDDVCTCEDEDALCCMCGKGKRCIDRVCTDVKMVLGSVGLDWPCPKPEDMDSAARNASLIVDKAFNHTHNRGNCPTDAICGSLIVEFQIFYDINSDLTIDEIEQIINDGFEEAGVPISKPFKTFRGKNNNQGLIIGLCVSFAVLGIVAIVAAILWIRHRSKNKVADEPSSTPRAEKNKKEQQDDKKEEKEDDDDT